MYPLLPLPTSAVLLIATLLFALLGIRLAVPAPHRRRAALAFGTVVLVPSILGLVLWQLGSGLGVRIFWTLLPIAFSVALSLPVVGVLLAVPRLVARFRSQAGSLRAERREGRRSTRRALIRTAAAAIPASAAFGGAGGFRHAGEPARLVHVPLFFPDLHPDLDGFRVLHLSDLHLGAGPRTHELEALLARAASERVDLVVLTGDVADDVNELVSGLRAVAAFPARFGALAALGNHEYLNGIERMRGAYEQSDVPLLVNTRRSLRVGRAELIVAGVDDPVYRPITSTFYEQAVASVAEGAAPDAFRLLLCHRPRGFDAAVRHGFHLTLSGHTHGGQLGLFGKSLFELLFGVRYMWGRYERRGSYLYTTSGFGHWFPFRLGCPAEAPLITLRRGPDSTDRPRQGSVQS
jgi:uncharacterized protein